MSYPTIPSSTTPLAGSSSDWRKLPAADKRRLLEKIRLQALYLEAERDAEARAERLKNRALRLSDLFIRTKERKVVPFRPNAVQRLYLDTIHPAWAADPVGLQGKRELILKARQFGFSTLILAALFLDTVSVPNTQSVVIAHDVESTERLFQMVKRFYRLLPDECRPAIRTSNRRELSFEELDSYFYVGTAGSGNYGRGGTINNVHGSEVAFWPDAEEIVSGLLEAVPAAGNVFLESTANGQNNWFHDEFQAAELSGDSAFAARFFAWWQHEEYREEPPADFDRTAEEQVLADRYDLDDAQLHWRRGKAKSLRRKLPQEYPANSQEAFITSGGRVLSEFLPFLAPKGHLCPSFIPPRTWRHYLIVDPGWNTCAVLFAAVDPEGRVWLYGEHYEGKQAPAYHLDVICALRLMYGSPEYTVLMDPAGFPIRRTDTGQESPGWEELFARHARQIGAEWFKPAPGDNRDPQALNVNDYLAADQLRVMEHLAHWRTEAARWVRKVERAGRYAQETEIPEDPIKRWRHLMDCTRYLCNLLPKPLPVSVAKPPRTPEDIVDAHLERAIKRKRRPAHL